MKVGDLVEVKIRDIHVGMVVNTWKNHKNILQAVDVLLSNGEIKNIGTYACKVINATR